MPLLNWRAQELLTAVATAERAALIETLDAAVAAAKANHGWQSRTGTALSSIQREDVKFRSEEAGLRLALAGRGTGERGLVSAFGFMPVALTGNTHRARSQKTGRLRKPRKWDVHGIFLEIGFRSRSGDRTIRRAADREFPKFPERIRQHLLADMRS